MNIEKGKNKGKINSDPDDDYTSWYNDPFSVPGK
jgi:hypothetical protein